MKKIIALVAVSLTLLTACSSQGVGENAIPDTTFVISREIPAVPDNNPNGPVEGIRIVSETVVIVNVGGSSSCPPVIEKVIANESNNVVELFLKDYGDVGCTADFGLLPQRVTAVGVNFNFNDYEFRKCMNNNCSAIPIS